MIEKQKQQASDWFRSLQKQICSVFEALETEAPTAIYGETPGRFEMETWSRGPDTGGGIAKMMRGRLFEKVGVHTSEIFGDFPEEFSAQIHGAETDPSFWAAGISLIAHMRNPRIPAAHMNTRLVVTAKSGFGGGADLTPTLAGQRTPKNPDARRFHAAIKAACNRHPVADYTRFKKKCDDYFYLAHRDEPRGIGGIFYEHLDSGDRDADFAFTKDVGKAFLDIYPEIIRARMNERWTDTEREEQLILRGRYVEFNLLYDRGTTFGLNTGGNVKTILSSMPPVVKWP